MPNRPTGVDIGSPLPGRGVTVPDKIHAITRIRNFCAKPGSARLWTQRNPAWRHSAVGFLASRPGLVIARRTLRRPLVMLRDWVGSATRRLAVLRKSGLPHSLGRMSMATTVLSLEGKESVLAGGE